MLQLVNLKPLAMHHIVIFACGTIIYSHLLEIANKEKCISGPLHLFKMAEV